jgi:hypothetical protein
MVLALGLITSPLVRACCIVCFVCPVLVISTVDAYIRGRYAVAVLSKENRKVTSYFLNAFKLLENRQ